MDLVWNVIDAELPTEVITASPESFNPDVTPVNMTATYVFPANAWREQLRVTWYQGGAMPGTPLKWVDLKNIDHGAWFKGEHGFIIADFTNLVLYPYGAKADLTYYRPPTKETLLPELTNFQKQWTDACKNGKPQDTACNFKYSADMIETLCLGLVGFRTGQTLAYDGRAGVVTNHAEANALLTKPYRAGYPMNG
jgi:hypothetical protein